jgi:hypothetical protein
MEGKGSYPSSPRRRHSHGEGRGPRRLYAGARDRESRAMGSGSEHRKGATGSNKEHHRGATRWCHGQLWAHACTGEGNHSGAAFPPPVTMDGRRSLSVAVCGTEHKRMEGGEGKNSEEEAGGESPVRALAQLSPRRRR